MYRVAGKIVKGFMVSQLKPSKLAVTFWLIFICQAFHSNPADLFGVAMRLRSASHRSRQA